MQQAYQKIAPLHRLKFFCIRLKLEKEEFVFMAKCRHCNKKGLFLKLDANGLCADCRRILSLQNEENSLTENIKKLTAEYNHIRENKESLYNQICHEAKETALQEISDKIQEQTQTLEKINTNIEENDATLNSKMDEITSLDKKINLAANKLIKLQTMSKSMKHCVDNYFNTDDETQYKNIQKESILNFVEDLLSTTVKLKFNFMNVKELRKRYNQNDKIIKELLVKYQSRYTTKTNMALYQLMVIALEAEMQNVLYNLKYEKLEKAIESIKLITKKYLKIVTDGNQSIAPTITRFIGEIEYLYIENIKIEYEYYVKQQRIKDEQRALREQMRQEAAERKQLELERKKIEQEEAKYKNEIESVQLTLQQATDAAKIKQLQQRILEIQGQLNTITDKKETITTLQHGKAGYIYVISNYGAFGNDVFKIGMTRRLDPQERIDELGGASVPFNFDVHSFIFSDNAPTLENEIHKRLHNKRINKVNLRKEFFKVSIDELEKIIYEISPTAEFNKTMLAEQYNESLSIDDIPDDYIETDDFDDEPNDIDNDDEI